MATWRALTNQAGTHTQIASPDVLSVGGGLVTDSGNMLLTPAGTDVQLGAAKNLSGASGAGSVDFSSMTGTFKTPTGNATMGGATTFSAAGTALTVTNNATISGTLTAGAIDKSGAGMTLGANTTSMTIGKAATTASFAGSATFNGLATLGAGLAASGAVANDFSGSTGTFLTSTGAVTIGPGATTLSGAVTLTAAGTALTVNNNALVSGTLTVTGALTVGSIVAAGLIASGLTTTAMTGGSGTAGYVSGASAITPTDNAAASKSRFFGVYLGTSGQAQVSGTVAAMQFTTVGGSPANGAPVFLAAAADDSAAGAGKLTATAPSTVGSVVAEVGICLDNGSYAGSKTAKVLLQPKSIVQL